MRLIYRLYIRHLFFFIRGFVMSYFLKRKPMTAPIDFVVTWVDGGDPVWQEEKRKYEDKDTGKENAIERYREWDLFRYWFRGVEKYAPWVNKVYLVTCGHVPAWINRDHPKLVLVSHKDFMDESYLPTFNSYSIEANLHRIKGLSEHFLYFNDDMFLIQPVKPEDFFQDGKPLVCSLATPLMNTPDNGNFGHTMFSVFGLMNKYDWEDVIEKHPEKWFYHGYGSRLMYNWHTYQQRFLTGIYFTHMPQAFRKSTYGKVWEAFPKELDETSRHKFRTPFDMLHFLFTMQEIVDGDYVPMPCHYYGKIFADMPEEPEQFAENISHQRYRIMCVNDNALVTSSKYDKIRNCVQMAFEEILPGKSSYEKE